MLVSGGVDEDECLIPPQAHVGFVDYLDLTSLVVEVIHKVMKEAFPETKTLALLEPEHHHKFISEAKAAYNEKTLFDIAGEH